MADNLRVPSAPANALVARPLAPAVSVVGRRPLIWCGLLALLALLPLTVFVSPARASSEIYVTTTAQGLAADDKCSLQEAIYSANLDNNIAPHPAGQFTTACTAGSGADTIVLLPPGGAHSR